MQKRLTTCFAAIAVASLIFTGCADKSTRVSETPGDAAASQSQAATSEQKTQVMEENAKPSMSQSGSSSMGETSKPASSGQSMPAASESKAEPKVVASTSSAAPQSAMQQSATVTPQGLYTVYFEYDKSRITPEAQSILDKNFEVLQKNSGAKALIVGHCDERGTNEYNMALGDRRANSTKTYLVNRGISASRLDTLSKGEEEPADPGHDEAAWAKNRRAQFIDR